MFSSWLKAVFSGMNRLDMFSIDSSACSSINSSKDQVEMTFKSGNLKRKPATITLSDLAVGQRVDGIVKKVEDYGVFVAIKGSKVSGLCHKSEVRFTALPFLRSQHAEFTRKQLVDSSGPSVSEILRTMKPGDSVRAKVLALDLTKNRISFGLKPSYFFDEDLDNEKESVAEDGSASEGEPDVDADIIMDDIHQHGTSDEEDQEVCTLLFCLQQYSFANSSLI